MNEAAPQGRLFFCAQFLYARNESHFCTLRKSPPLCCVRSQGAVPSGLWPRSQLLPLNQPPRAHRKRTLQVYLWANRLWMALFGLRRSWGCCFCTPRRGTRSRPWETRPCGPYCSPERPWGSSVLCGAFVALRPRARMRREPPWH